MVQITQNKYFTDVFCIVIGKIRYFSSEIQWGTANS